MTVDDLKEAMKKGFRRIHYEKAVEVHADRDDLAVGDFTWTVYTDRHKYRITAKSRSESRPDGYLGCIAKNRKAHAGEDWLRGNDLADGPLTEETWVSILLDIIGYELVPISPKQEAKPVLQEATPA